MCTKGFLHPKVTCDGIEEAYTESAAKHLNQEASKEIEADLKKAVPQVIKADAALSIENGQFTLDTKWNKQLAEKAPMSMTIQMPADHQKQMPQRWPKRSEKRLMKRDIHIQTTR